MRIIRETGRHFDLDETRARDLLHHLLSRPLFARLATASEQKGQRESPVWFLWEEEALWIIGNYRTGSFPKWIEKDPRCAIGIVEFNVETGLVQHVGFRGGAHLRPHDRSRLVRLLSRYLGGVDSWDESFVEILDDEDYIFIRFEPETAVVRDQSYTVGAKAHVTSLRT